MASLVITRQEESQQLLHSLEYSEPAVRETDRRGLFEPASSRLMLATKYCAEAGWGRETHVRVSVHDPNRSLAV